MDFIKRNRWIIFWLAIFTLLSIYHIKEEQLFEETKQVQAVVVKKKTIARRIYVTVRYKVDKTNYEEDLSLSIPTGEKIEIGHNYYKVCAKIARSN